MTSIHQELEKQNPSKKVVEFLLSSKVDINILDNYDNLPFFCALKNNKKINFGIIQSFLKHKADLNIQSKNSNLFKENIFFII
jgi:ankyrin repeat protein